MMGVVFRGKKIHKNLPRYVLGKFTKFQKYLIRNKSFANKIGEVGLLDPSPCPGLDRIKPISN